MQTKPELMEIRRKWNVRRAAVAALGLLLWLQLCAGALARELALPEPDSRRAVVLFVPCGLLLVTVIWRSRPVGLLLFPTSFGATLMVTSRAALDTLGAPFSFVLASLTLAAYVLVASAWMQLPAHQPFVEASREPLRHGSQRWRAYDGTFMSRAVLLLAIFLVSAAAVPLLPGLVRRIAGPTSWGASGDTASVDQGIVICNVVLFFAWCVLAYTIFLGPTIEMESRVRQLETRLQASLVKSQRGWRRLAFFASVGVALLLMATLVAVRARS